MIILLIKSFTGMSIFVKGIKVCMIFFVSFLNSISRLSIFIDSEFQIFCSENYIINSLLNGYHDFVCFFVIC